MAPLDATKPVLLLKAMYYQQEGIDFHETFSPVIKPTNVRLLLSIDVSCGWTIRQLDVNNAFLNVTLFEKVCMSQPHGFKDSNIPTYVCRLHKSLYGLKQAPRAWFVKITEFLLSHHFVQSQSDHSLFIFCYSDISLYVLIYIDDIIITGNSISHVSDLIRMLGSALSLSKIWAI